MWISSRRPRPARARHINFVPGSPIATTVGSSAGVATVSGVAVGIFAAVGSSDGAASVTGVGAGVIAAAGASAGVASVSGVGSGYLVTVGTAAGAATVEGRTELRQIISTNMLQKPVNCVLAGQQVSFKTGRAAGKALRHAFGE